MVLKIVRISLLIYIIFGLVLFYWQRSFMYFPVAENLSRNVLHEYLESEGEMIKVWVLGPDKDKAVIYFGGNAEDVNASIANFQNTLPDHTVYLVNYRGYGGSSGSPTQKNLFSDALTIYETLKKRHSQLSIIGRSLGSGVAIFLASKRPIHRLVLVTPFDSVLAIAQRRYPMYPVSIMLHDRYESVDYAPLIEAPTLIVIAEHDDVIPMTHSTKLAEGFAANLVERLIIENAIHNDLGMYRKYWEVIRKFLGYL